MQEPTSPEAWVKALGLTLDNTTDADDVEGAWEDAKTVYGQSKQAVQQGNGGA